MKILNAIPRWVLAIVGGVCLGGAQAQSDDREGHVDVIVQMGQGAEQVRHWVEANGGSVRFRYDNVTAIAVTLPASQLDSLNKLVGVALVERDRMVYVHDDLGRDAQGNPQMSAGELGVDYEVESLEPDVSAGVIEPAGYQNFIYTGASAVWTETQFGAGSVVAVVDTGVATNAALIRAVIGAPGFPNGYNAYPDGFSATDLSNGWHGTAVAGVIAASANVTLSNSSSPLYRAIAAHMPQWRPATPGGRMTVPIRGQAPNAKIYPVKVFPHSGGATPTSVILNGLDHVLTLKKSGALDIDVVNLSLGGPTVWDGMNTFDQFLAELTNANILVVTSAGNDGPVPNTVGSPATSFNALRVGALDYPETSRVMFEYLGLTSSKPCSGQGLIMRPTTEVRVANFSARGPLSDGRMGPEISALGLYNFGVMPGGTLSWFSGTSFSAPTVSGAAALLNSYWEASGSETSPAVLRNVLLRGANATLVGPSWRSVTAQGLGALDVAAALSNLKTNQITAPTAKRGRPLRANILGEPEDDEGVTRGESGERGEHWGDTEHHPSNVWESPVITLQPSETYDSVLHIGRHTSRVLIEVFGIQAPDNSTVAFYPNALEVHVQSAKRTALSQPIALYWYPHLQGAAFTIDVTDGPWTCAGKTYADQPMEPGLMKITLAGDYVNQSPVSFQMRVTRIGGLPEREEHRIAEGRLLIGQQQLVPIDIPAGTTNATFDLRWERDWSRLPTSDFDMVILDGAGVAINHAGASLNAPERTVLTNPAPGRYYVRVSAAEVYKEDTFQLFLHLAPRPRESEPEESHLAESEGIRSGAQPTEDHHEQATSEPAQSTVLAPAGADPGTAVETPASVPSSEPSVEPAPLGSAQASESQGAESAPSAGGETEAGPADPALEGTAAGTQEAEQVGVVEVESLAEGASSAELEALAQAEAEILGLLEQLPSSPDGARGN